jgi:hypothetical protein
MPMQRIKYFGVGAAATVALAATAAHATVTISSAATTNMTCSGGVCAPTATKAVLNVGDLETLLASGNVTVTTTGTGVQASDIDVKATLGWSSSGALSLLANKSIAIDNPVSITGLSGLTIGTGKSGTFSFGSKGHVTFANLSSKLSIDGVAYTLVGDVKSLADSGNSIALANNYDASVDGTYKSCPISTVFTGTFTGLGNTISNLSISGGTEIDGELIEGLFVEIGPKGTVKNIGLVNAAIVAPVKYMGAGSLVGSNYGVIISSFATGMMTFGKKASGGGLVAGNYGTIENSYATDRLTGSAGDIGGLVGGNGGVILDSYASGTIATSGDIGGLAATNNGTIDGSYATGTITAKGKGTLAGGLVGFHEAGVIENSYASGKVKGGKSGGGGPNASSYGGLVGKNVSTISFSYSTGAVTGGAGNYIGGLVGADGSPSGSITDTYWDTDTSGITNLGQGAGNIVNDPGITGLTTTEFQFGLPQGFDPKVWAEKSNIDDGFPYLLANPPAKK